MEGNDRRRRRGAGLMTFPADFTGGREVKITAPPAHCSRPPLLPSLLPAFWRRAYGACFSPSAHWAIEGVMDGFIRRQDPSLIHKISLLKWPYHSFHVALFSVLEITALTFFLIPSCSLLLFFNCLSFFFLQIKECFSLCLVASLLTPKAGDRCGGLAFPAFPGENRDRS